MQSLLMLFFAIIATTADINTNIFKPEDQFQDRRTSFLVSCNTSAMTNDVLMFFTYNNKNYTVPRIDNMSGLYNGNFSAISKEQNKVMLMCKDVKNNKFLGSKVYFLGYPPTVIAEHYKVTLQCRDYNLIRMICCVTPNVSAMEQLLGFVDDFNGSFEANLYYYDFENNEVAINRSCYKLTKQTLAPSITLHFLVKNILGSTIFNFTIDRLSILRPNKPKYIQRRINSTSFDFDVDMIDLGEYVIYISCSSLTPVITSKAFSFIMDGSKSDMQTSGSWPQNSHISCIIKAYVRFGNSSVGHSSEELEIYLTLLEGKPSCGPTISPLLVDYLESERSLLINVTIYFMDVDLINRNGIITSYRWNCTDCFFECHNRSNMDHNLPSSSRYIKLDNAALGSNISMAACTAVGCSDTWTTFSFQPLKEDPPDRRFSIIENSDKRNTFTIVWYQTNESFFLVCTYSDTENDCSSIERINLINLTKNYMEYQISTHSKVKFSIISSLAERNFKLKWDNCTYKSSSFYESEKKLRNLDYVSYITELKNCNFDQCEVQVNIRIPRCDEFSFFDFNALVISYENSRGVRDLRVPILSNRNVQFTLTNLGTGFRTFNANITVMNKHNSQIMWFQRSYTTRIWIRWFLVIMIVGIFAIILCVSVSCCIFIRTETKKLRKNHSNKPQNQTVLMNNSIVSPVNLWNTEKVDFSTSYVIPKVSYEPKLTSQERLLETLYDDSENCLIQSGTDRCSTASTSFESSETFNQSVEDIIAIVPGNDSKPYCPIPTHESDKQYSQIAIPIVKNERITKAQFESTNA